MKIGKRGHLTGLGKPGETSAIPRLIAALHLGFFTAGIGYDLKAKPEKP
jgi:hypothetical protein